MQLRVRLTAQFCGLIDPTHIVASRYKKTVKPVDGGRRMLNGHTAF
jgi:hypothetical protein